MKAVSAQVVSCCVLTNRIFFMLNMHGNILYMFDCWDNRVVHLLLRKSSQIHRKCVDASPFALLNCNKLNA